jgi:hypothetical protein
VAATDSVSEPIHPADIALSNRLQQGLRDLAWLADQADTIRTDALWDLVIDLDAATARAISFCAATLVSEQRSTQRGHESRTQKTPVDPAVRKSPPDLESGGGG